MDNNYNNGFVGSPSPVVTSSPLLASSSSPSSSPLTAVIVVAEREATINPTDMVIETALAEYMDAIIVTNDHCNHNGKNSNNEKEGEEALIPLLTREGGTGVRRAGEEKSGGGNR